MKVLTISKLCTNTKIDSKFNKSYNFLCCLSENYYNLLLWIVYVDEASQKEVIAALFANVQRYNKNGVSSFKQLGLYFCQQSFVINLTTRSMLYKVFYVCVLL